MRLVRVNVCWLITVALGTAIAMVPGLACWDWHHAMLERSRLYVDAAYLSEREAKARVLRATAHLRITESGDQTGIWPEYYRKVAEVELLEAGDHKSLAEQCRRAAAFPWLVKPRLPKPRPLPALPPLPPRPYRVLPL